jgi:hypothetical protein
MNDVENVSLIRNGGLKQSGRQVIIRKSEGMKGFRVMMQDNRLANSYLGDTSSQPDCSNDDFLEELIVWDNEPWSRHNSGIWTLLAT